jgi:hypothetical protein
MTLTRMGCAMLLALGLALMLIPTGAIAAESGEIVALRGGTLERLERDVWREIVVHAAVRVGDRLRTGKGAVAVIAFPVLGRFVMGPGSEIELGRAPKDFTTQVDRGALWLRATPTAGSRAALSSPYAIAGVRGTAFSMLYSADGKTVCACTCTGSVEVRTPDGAKVQVPRGAIRGYQCGRVGARVGAVLPGPLGAARHRVRFLPELPHRRRQGQAAA